MRRHALSTASRSVRERSLRKRTSMFRGEGGRAGTAGSAPARRLKARQCRSSWRRAQRGVRAAAARHLEWPDHSVKRITLLVPALVALALLVGWWKAHWTSGESDLPSFAPPNAPHFEELRAPSGPAKLHGRVVDIDGAAVAGVALYLRSGGVPMWQTSDADGRFAFEGLE